MMRRRMFVVMLALAALLALSGTVSAEHEAGHEDDDHTTTVTSTVDARTSVTSTTTATVNQTQINTNESPIFAEQTQIVVSESTVDLDQANAVAPAGGSSTDGTSEGGATTTIVKNVEQATWAKVETTQTATFGDQVQASEQTIIAGDQVAEAEAETEIAVSTNVQDSGNIVDSGNIIDVDVEVPGDGDPDPGPERTVTVSFVPSAPGVCEVVVEGAGFASPGTYLVVVTIEGEGDFNFAVFVDEDGTFTLRTGLLVIEGQTVTATVGEVSSGPVEAAC